MYIEKYRVLTFCIPSIGVVAKDRHFLVSLALPNPLGIFEPFSGFSQHDESLPSAHYMLQKTARMAAIMGRSSLRPLANSLPGQSGLVLGSSRKHGYATSPAAGPAEVQSQTPIHSTPEPAVKASKLTSLGSVSWGWPFKLEFPSSFAKPARLAVKQQDRQSSADKCKGKCWLC